jgi:hypothetical protein
MGLLISANGSDGNCGGVEGSHRECEKRRHGPDASLIVICLVGPLG